jgi:hypothetical protein
MMLTKCNSRVRLSDDRLPGWWAKIKIFRFSTGFNPTIRRAIEKSSDEIYPDSIMQRCNIYLYINHGSNRVPRARRRIRKEQLPCGYQPVDEVAFG